MDSDSSQDWKMKADELRKQDEVRRRQFEQQHQAWLQEWADRIVVVSHVISDTINPVLNKYPVYLQRVLSAGYPSWDGISTGFKVYSVGAYSNVTPDNIPASLRNGVYTLLGRPLGGTWPQHLHAPALRYDFELPQSISFGRDEPPNQIFVKVQCQLHHREPFVEQGNWDMTKLHEGLIFEHVQWFGNLLSKRS